MKLVCSLAVVLILSGMSLAAPQVLLNTEEDSGQAATDKLMGDGAQNPIFYGAADNASVDTNPANARFGSCSLRFNQGSGSYDLNKIELAGTQNLGTAFTLALWVKLDAGAATGQDQEIFSNYLGGGDDTNLILITPTSFNSRFRVDFQDQTWSVWTGDIRGTGYHHYAITYNDGVVKAYMDGIYQGSFTTAGGAYTNDYNLCVGGNRLAGGQVVGNVDEVLVYDSALTDGQIASLFATNRGPWSSNAPQILINAEGDSGQAATDKLTDDGVQNPTFYGAPDNASVDTNPANAKFGSRSLRFNLDSTSIATLNKVELAGTDNLGIAFTLALWVKLDAGGTSDQQIFSNYYGGGSDPNAILITPNNSNLAFRVDFQDNFSSVYTGDIRGTGYHHYAVTYNNGLVKMYMDGVYRSSFTTTAGGAYTSPYNLCVGANRFAGGQVVGNVDDVLVYDRALSAAEIRKISRQAAGPMPQGSGWSQNTFPMGWYTDGISGWAPLQTITLDESQQHGFEFVMPYFISNSPIEQILDYLDAAEARGVKVMVYLSVLPIGPDSVANALHDVDIVNNHPALYGYYLSDEPDLVFGNDNTTASNVLTDTYNAVKQASPNYPTFVTFSRPIASPEVQFYLSVADVIARTKYHTSDVLEVQSDVAAARSAGKKFLVVPGAFQEPTALPPKPMTTPEEFHYLVFGSVAAGADGIWPFIFHGLYLAPPLPSDWRDQVVYSSTDILRAITPELLMGPNGLSVTTNFIQGTTRIAGTSTDAVLVAVNNSTSAQNSVSLTLSGLNPAITEAMVLGENRAVPIVNNVLVDNFTAQGVHIYKFARYTNTDLAAVLGAMDTANTTVDKDGDGIITSSDLAIVLANLE